MSAGILGLIVLMVGLALVCLACWQVRRQRRRGHVVTKLAGSSASPALKWVDGMPPTPPEGTVAGGREKEPVPAAPPAAKRSEVDAAAAEARAARYERDRLQLELGLEAARAEAAVCGLNDDLLYLAYEILVEMDTGGVPEGVEAGRVGATVGKKAVQWVSHAMEATERRRQQLAQLLQEQKGVEGWMETQVAELAVVAEHLETDCRSEALWIAPGRQGEQGDIDAHLASRAALRVEQERGRLRREVEQAEAFLARARRAKEEWDEGCPGRTKQLQATDEAIHQLLKRLKQLQAEAKSAPARQPEPEPEPDPQPVAPVAALTSAPAPEPEASSGPNGAERFSVTLRPAGARKMPRRSHSQPPEEPPDSEASAASPTQLHGCKTQEGLLVL